MGKRGRRSVRRQQHNQAVVGDSLLSPLVVPSDGAVRVIVEVISVLPTLLLSDQDESDDGAEERKTANDAANDRAVHTRPTGEGYQQVHQEESR